MAAATQGVVMEPLDSKRGAPSSHDAKQIQEDFKSGASSSAGTPNHSTPTVLPKLLVAPTGPHGPTAPSYTPSGVDSQEPGADNMMDVNSTFDEYQDASDCADLIDKHPEWLIKQIRSMLAKSPMIQQEFAGSVNELFRARPALCGKMKTRPEFNTLVAEFRFPLVPKRR